MKRPLGSVIVDDTANDVVMDGSSTAAVQGVVDKVVEELTSGNEQAIIHGYKILHSLHLDRKQWDRLLSKSVMSSVQNHLSTSAKDAVKGECLEALVSVATSEYACRRLYACQLMPVLITCLSADNSPMIQTGLVQLMAAFVECIGEAAVNQIHDAVVRLCNEYKSIQDHKLRWAVSELLEIVSEDGQLQSVLPPMPTDLDCTFKDNTMSQLCLFMAHLNSVEEPSLHRHIIDSMVSYVDASRRAVDLYDNVLHCLEKIYRILANAFHCAHQPTAIASRHLESVLAEEVQRVLSTLISSSAMNAFANYLTLTTTCSLPQDLVDHLKQQVIAQFKQDDDTVRQSASNLLRAMSMVCDFTLSPQEESAIYTLDGVAAGNCAAIAFFCTPTAERDAFIKRQLQTCNDCETVCEFVEAALQYDNSGRFSKTVLRAALQRVDDGVEERVRELMSVLK